MRFRRLISSIIISLLAACPYGWYVNGVHRNGVFECRPVLGDPAHDVSDARDGVIIDDDRRIIGVVICVGTPVQDGRKVWCM